MPSERRARREANDACSSRQVGDVRACRQAMRARRQAMRARREASSHADMRTPTGKQRERMSTNERRAHADRRATSACRQASYFHACRKAIDAHARQHALTIDAHARQHALATHANGTTFALVASAWPAQTINMFPISRQSKLFTIYDIIIDTFATTQLPAVRCLATVK